MQTESVVNQLSQLPTEFSKDIKNFGITEVFLLDGELHTTSHYDLPAELTAKIETFLNTPATPLQHLLPMAVRSFNGTSMNPEGNGARFISDYESLLSEDLEKISKASEGTKKYYTERFTHHLTNYIAARGRIVSPFITGASNFPVQRMLKYGRWEDSAYKKFSEFRERAIKGILKNVKACRTGEEINNELWVKLQKDITSACGTIIGIDSGVVRGFSRPLFVSVLVRVVEAQAKAGNVEMTAKCIDLIKEITEKHAKKAILSKSNKVWGLLDTCKENAVALQVAHENKTFEFSDFDVVYNFEANRIQVAHYNKPDQDTINKLKSNSFRWSPTAGAWQRHLNNGSIYTTMNVFSIQLPQL